VKAPASKADPSKAKNTTNLRKNHKVLSHQAHPRKKPLKRNRNLN
jgi:hypothetical protein